MRTLFVLMIGILACQGQLAQRRMLLGQGAPVFAAGSTLNNNLVAYWKFDEVSGNLVDSFSTNHFIRSNAVTSVTGLIGNAAQFNSNSLQTAFCPDNPNVSTDFSSWVFAGWFRFYTTNISSGMAGKWSASAPNREWRLDRATDSRIQFQFSTNGTASLTLNSTVKPSTNDWVFIAAMVDTNALKMFLVVNTTWVTNSIASGYNTNGATSLKLGFGTSTYFDGEIDEVGFWKGRVLTSDEITELINAGAGKTCCQF